MGPFAIVVGPDVALEWLPVRVPRQDQVGLSFLAFSWMLKLAPRCSEIAMLHHAGVSPRTSLGS